METPYGQDLFASGRSDALFHSCLSSGQQRNLHTFKTDENDPLFVMPRAQTRLQVSLEKREYQPNPDDSRHQLSPMDAPADLSLFTTESSCAAWNSSLLDKLLSSLNQSLEQLEEVTVDCPDLGIAVRKYFQGIHLYLKGKEYSPCAWEVVRVEIEKYLSLM